MPAAKGSTRTPLRPIHKIVATYVYASSQHTHSARTKIRTYSKNEEQNQLNQLKHFCLAFIHSFLLTKRFISRKVFYLVHISLVKSYIINFKTSNSCLFELIINSSKCLKSKGSNLLEIHLGGILDLLSPVESLELRER